jgi:diguanylate cyclase (GGDEF)-like protein
VRQPSRRTAQRATFGLAAILGAAAAALVVMTQDRPALQVDSGQHATVWIALLAVLFAIGEIQLIHIEFRRQAYSYTLSGIPLVLGLAACSPRDVVIARVIGATVAFAIQRPAFAKATYNLAAYAFEVAASGVVIQHLFGVRRAFGLMSSIDLYAAVASMDILMTCLVLLVISMHQGPGARARFTQVLGPAVPFTLTSSAAAFTALMLARGGAFGDVLLAVMGAMGVLAYHSYQRLHRRHEALSLVHAFIQEAASEQLIDEASGALLERIRTLMKAGRVELTVAHDGALTQVVATESGLVESPADPGDWLLAKVRAVGDPLLVTRRVRDRAQRRWLESHGLRDAVIVPFSAAESSGTLMIGDRVGEVMGFSRDDLLLLQALTGHLAVSVQNSQLLDRLRYDATHDALTDLANRALLNQALDERLARATEPLAVLLIDLDRFKEVNDALGHHVGDELLRVVAHRLMHHVPADSLVARLGGDEFAVLLSGDDIAARSHAIAHALAADIAQPIALSDAVVTTQISVGVAIAEPGATHNDLLRKADTAMYAAKADGRAVVTYTPELDRGRAERLALGADLQLALTRGELVLFYQPKLDLATRRVIGVEALARWMHPRLGLLDADAFIPLAEVNGLIDDLTVEVLGIALRQSRVWSEMGIELSVAVNLSARNVGNPKLPEIVAAALAAADVPADRLVLEITESSVMGDSQRTMPVLEHLARMGITLSLDDFGTGYSSLSYLQRLPVREVKVDRSFVMGLSNSASARASEALIRSIAGLGDSLQLNIVAEGVEDAQTLAKLRAFGCHVAQGYYIGRPDDAERTTDLLRQINDPRPRLHAVDESPVWRAVGD